MLTSQRNNVSVPTFPVEHAVRHICAQHRNLARVFRAMESHLSAALTKKTRPDFVLIDCMLHYVGAFTGRMHHPSEEKYLFSAMIRAGAPADVMEKVGEAHWVGANKLADLRRAFDEWRSHPAMPDPMFLTLAPEYLAFEFDHMYYEESVILPCAIEILPASDWPKIAQAFLGHEDPLFGSAPAAALLPLHQYLQS